MRRFPLAALFMLASALPGWANETGFAVSLELVVVEQHLVDTLAADHAEYVSHSFPANANWVDVHNRVILPLKGRFLLTARLRPDGTWDGEPTVEQPPPSDRLNQELGQQALVLAPGRAPSVGLQLVDVREAGEDAFDVTWQGTAKQNRLVSGKEFKRLQAEGGPIQLDLQAHDPRFRAVCRRAIQEANSLLREADGPARDVASAALSLPKLGMTRALTFQPDPITGKEVRVMESSTSLLGRARRFVAKGNLVKAQALLYEAERQGGAPGAPIVQRVMNAKQLILDRVLLHAVRLRAKSEPYVRAKSEPPPRELHAAYQLVKRLNSLDGWTLSSALPLDLAKTFLRVENHEQALEALSTAERCDPSLRSSRVFKTLEGQARLGTH